MRRSDLVALADLVAVRLADELEARGVALLRWVPTGADPVADLRSDVAAWRARLSCDGAVAGYGAGGYTYAVQFRGLAVTPVKLGRTVDLLDRLSDLQRMSPFPLTLVGLWHGAEYERDLHARWHQERLHGEWFDGRALAGWLAETREADRCEACPPGRTAR